MIDQDLLIQLFDYYAENGYLHFMWKGKCYDLLPEEGDVVLIEGSTEIRRFLNIQEAMTYFAKEKVVLL